MNCVRLLGFAVAGQMSVMGAYADVPLTADIVVSGGSFGAPAAALAAARANPSASILLIEPTDWLGGQATAQGVSAIDNVWFPPAQAIMANYREDYYPADYLQFLNDMSTSSPAAPGTGMSPEGTSWVSRESFDPRTGAWVLDQMIASYPKITVKKMTVVKDVATSSVTDSLGDANVITSLSLIQRTPIPGYIPFTKFLSEELPDWFSSTDSADFEKQEITVTAADPARGLVVIDASETADAIVLSNAKYVVGREKTTEVVSPDGTIPEHYEHYSQAVVFPFCMTDAPAPADESELKAPWSDFDSSYAVRVASYFGFGTWDYKRVWTYRRLKTTGPVPKFDNVYQGDVTMQNWYPGNDYPDKSIFMDKADAAAQTGDWLGGLDLTGLAGAEKLAIQFYFYMKAHNTESWDTHYLHGDDPLNMMGTPTGLAKFPYIRCGRRIIGLQNFRLLQRYLYPAKTGADAGTSYRFYDSVAIGDYAMDAHNVAGSKGITHGVEKPAPFYLPYRALASANVRNLLAGGKDFAGTFWTNSAYRLHPIEWGVGSAAGVAAALMSRDYKTNADMLELPALREMQTEIAKNSPISWKAYDNEVIPPKNGDLVVNDLKQVKFMEPFSMQIYAYGATRAEVYLNGEKAGETSNRVNDCLVYENAVGTTNPLKVEVRCYDTTGSLLATLKQDVEVLNVPDDPYVVDNADPRFSMIGGIWNSGSAQADRYGDSYRFTDGVGGLRKAVWNLTVPAPGNYEVSVWYPAANNRAIDSPFTIYYQGGYAIVPVNQRVGGGQWQPLGVFPFTGASGEKVELSNLIGSPAANTNYVLADAVRVYPVPTTIVEAWKAY